MADGTQGAGDILFSGTYTNGIILNNPATQNPATIAASGLVINSGTAVYGSPGTAWTVANLGTVTGNGTHGAGIVLESGGLVENGAPGATTALISENGLFGPSVGPSILVGPGGTVINYGTLANGAATLSGTILNYGTIDAAVSDLSGTIVNYGHIAGQIQATGSSGLLVNTGTIIGTSSQNGLIGSISSDSLANYGTIENTQTNSGVSISSALYNGPGGLIDGGSAGVSVFSPDTYNGRQSSNASITNAGTIRGAIGVYVQSYYQVSPVTTLVNTGTITGTGGTAVYFGSSADLLVAYPGAVFQGAVVGYGSTLELAAGYEPGRLPGLGVKFTGFSSVYVDSGAVWRLAGAGPAHRIVNDGTIAVYGKIITQGQLISDAGYSGTVSVDPGGVARFNGAVSADETVAFTGDGGTAVLARPLDFAGTVGGFGAGDTIDLVKSAADGLSFANGQLTVTNQGAAVADLHLFGSFTTADFALSPDTHGGTEITFADPAPLLAMKG